MARLTLGSLFDGSGGFPLGGLLAGITPVWASEIEPFPIRVTTRRLPKMKHLGDVSKINGAEIEPVDIITFGSPCTDMSIAGKRAGLGGEKSSLFYHAIRIIKEMRDATNGTYPRWACWENVFGAFSSNAGSDFKSVLDAFISIADPSAQVPAPEKTAGPTLTFIWETDGALRTGLLTRGIGECPREDAGSTLSQILQASVPDKYYLSPRACQGILRRASERGRKLPDVLRLALEEQARSA